MGLGMRKPDFAYAKTKTQISRAVTAQLISAFVFAIRIIQSIYFLNTKFQASSHILWLHSPVCVGPGRKPRRPVFSERGSYVCKRNKNSTHRSGRGYLYKRNLPTGNQGSFHCRSQSVLSFQTVSGSFLMVEVYLRSCPSFSSIATILLKDNINVEKHYVQVLWLKQVCCSVGQLDVCDLNQKPCSDA